MELVLNELSISVEANKFKANDTMIEFAKTVAEGKRKGFKNVRSHFATHDIKLAGDYTMENWLNDKDFLKSKDYKDILFGMVVLPFIKEEDEHIEEQYIKANYFYEDAENGVAKTNCVGLASAYLYDTLSISFSTSAYWHKTKLPIIIEDDGGSKSDIVYNVFSNTSFNTEEILKQIESYGNVVLEETKIKVADKKRHIAPHHGTKELNELCDQLELSPYVEEMRSTNWGGTKFIRKTTKEGFVEIVLYKTQRKYALLVKTTGRNKRETDAIAEILNERYS